MAGKYLLDTNIIIALFEGENAVLKKLKRAKTVYLSSVVVGELFFGAFKSNRAQEKRISNRGICGGQCRTGLRRCNGAVLWAHQESPKVKGKAFAG
jgi:hypothetical protein